MLLLTSKTYLNAHEPRINPNVFKFIDKTHFTITINFNQFITFHSVLYSFYRYYRTRI